MSSRWYSCREFSGFPFCCRLWIGWCAHGVKHRNGTTVAGSFLFRYLKKWLHAFPEGEKNYWPVPGERLGMSLMVDLVDLQTYIHTVPILSKGSNEFDLQSRILKPGMVFFDIGANYGLYAFHAAKLVGANGRVLAFEPQPRLVGALRHAKETARADNVEIIACAASDKEGMASFGIPAMASGTGSLLSGRDPSASAGARFDVTMTTVDRVCAERGIERVDLIKIDVEGAEYRALKGAAETIRRCRPLLWFEVNPEAQQRAGVTLPALFQLLSELGYTSFRRLVRGYPPVRSDESFTDLDNLVGIPTGREQEFSEVWSGGSADVQ